MKRYTIVVESSQGNNGVAKKGAGSASTTENESASDSGLKM
jgi:hypothetical protein